MAEEGRPEPSATTGAVEPVVAHVEEEAPAEAGLVDIASILGASTVTVVRSSLYVKSIFEYYVLVILLWLITKFVLSRKSTDLSWKARNPVQQLVKKTRRQLLRSPQRFLRLRPLLRAQRLCCQKPP
jgi:hypothetical protein